LFSALDQLVTALDCVTRFYAGKRQGFWINI
jgi:hypothetical protein